MTNVIRIAIQFIFWGAALFLLMRNVNCCGPPSKISLENKSGGTVVVSYPGESHRIIDGGRRLLTSPEALCIVNNSGVEWRYTNDWVHGRFDFTLQPNGDLIKPHFDGSQWLTNRLSPALTKKVGTSGNPGPTATEIKESLTLILVVAFIALFFINEGVSSSQKRVFMAAWEHSQQTIPPTRETRLGILKEWLQALPDWAAALPNGEDLRKNLRFFIYGRRILLGILFLAGSTYLAVEFGLPTTGSHAPC